MVRFTTAALLAGLFCLPAAAQQRVQQTGRALDANPQVGSNGVNNYGYEALADYQSRNAVITGNVVGGRHFRGRVGYGAPGSWGLGTGTRLPSDSLFNFERVAASSAPSQLNTPYVGAYAGQNNTRIYRGSTNLPSYETGGININRDLLQSSTGLQVLPDELVNTLRTQQDLTPGRQNLGLISDTSGQTYELSASPLLGLRRTRVSPNAAAPDMEPIRGESPQFPGNVPVRTPMDKDLAPGKPGQRLDADPLERVGLRQSTRVDLRQTGGGMGVGELFIDQPARQSGLLLGQQLQGRMAPALPAESLSDQVAQLEDRFFGRTDSTQSAPGRDVYMDLMRAAQAPEARREQDQPRPGQELRQVDPQDAEQARQPGAAFELPEPTPEQVQAVEQRRLETLQRLEAQRNALQEQQQEMLTRLRATSREQQLRREAEEMGDPDLAGDPTVQEAREKADAAIANLVDRLNYDLPPLTTMASEAERGHNQLVRSAEEKLAAGQFMDAAVLYRQAGRQAPDNPMIQVGLVHAQLGAGMMRSAGHNLRGLLADHPELAAARYDAKLLPSQERLKVIQGELQRMINQGVAVDDAGLLTAYLGYQAGSRQLVRYGLAVAQNAAAEDPLMPLLRAIWLDEKADTNGSVDQNEATQPAPIQAESDADAQVDDQPAPITP